jgi:hypothetical protein
MTFSLLALLLLLLLPDANRSTTRPLTCLQRLYCHGHRGTTGSNAALVGMLRQMVAQQGRQVAQPVARPRLCVYLPVADPNWWYAVGKERKMR